MLVVEEDAERELTVVTFDASLFWRTSYAFTTFSLRELALTVFALRTVKAFSGFCFAKSLRWLETVMRS